MANALEVFRQQREAAEQVRVTLLEVAGLLHSLRQQANALAGDADLRAVLRGEREWLAEAQRAVAAVRELREGEQRRHSWPAVRGRWAVVLAIAVLCAYAAGAGYATITSPNARELSDLRARAAFGDEIARRLQSLTISELRQFDSLMRPEGANDMHEPEEAKRKRR
jgi:hypothetical protein